VLSRIQAEENEKMGEKEKSEEDVKRMYLCTSAGDIASAGLREDENMSTLDPKMTQAFMQFQ